MPERQWAPPEEEMTVDLVAVFGTVGVGPTSDRTPTHDMSSMVMMMPGGSTVEKNCHTRAHERAREPCGQEWSNKKKKLPIRNKLCVSSSAQNTYR